MSAAVLERLRSDDFAVTTGYLLPAPALRRVLMAHPDVQAVISALAEGIVTETDVQTFASDLMKDLRAGERFRHDLVLAALAVVLNDRPTSFAEQFLRDLSGLELAELGSSIRVARECLQERRNKLNANHPSASDADLVRGPGTIAG